jgi:hypothetical protein
VGAGGLLDEAAQRIAELEEQITKAETARDLAQCSGVKHSEYWKTQAEEKDKRIAELEAKLRAVGALPDRWMSSKPTHDFGNGVTISYGGKSVDECADELHAILKEQGDENISNKRT